MSCLQSRGVSAFSCCGFIAGRRAIRAGGITIGLAALSSALGASALAGDVASAENPALAEGPELAAVLARPVAVEHPAPTTVIPFERHRHMLVIEAQANGVAREFVFDTGSPSMIARELADELGLRPVGSNTGRDANGAQVTMDFALLDRLEIGGVVFRQVPVLIFDFADIELGPCVFDGGVIGSEILPGSAWRIDAQAGEMTIGAPGAMPPADGAAVVAPLHPAGYPHPPISDYRIGAFSDRLLFDTGSGEAVVLYDKVAADPAVRGAIVPGSHVRGHGSHGVSAGGMGAPAPLERFTLDDFALGGRAIGPVRATTRVVPPSLIGTGLLDSYIVTLDYPGQKLVLEPRTDPAPARDEAGYSLAIAGGVVQITQVFEGSPAARAGLHTGDRIVAIDGARLPEIGPANRCDTMRWLAAEARPEAVERLTVLREGEEIALSLTDQ